MKLTVNGVKNVEVPSAMTIDMFVLSEAAKHMTIPDYIRVEASDYKDGGTVQYFDLVAKLREFSRKDFAKLQEFLKLKTNYDGFNLTKSDVVKIWVFSISEEPSISPIFISKISEHFKDLSNLDQRGWEVIIKNYGSIVDRNKESIGAIISDLKTIKEIPVTEYEIHGDDLKIRMPVKWSVLQCLDKMVMTDRIPFAIAKVNVSSGFLYIATNQDSKTCVKSYDKIYTP